MRLSKKIKRFFFGIHEIIWVVVHEIENWLYPQCDRPVDDIFQDDEEGISLLSASNGSSSNVDKIGID